MSGLIIIHGFDQDEVGSVLLQRQIYLPPGDRKCDLGGPVRATGLVIARIGHKRNPNLGETLAPQTDKTTDRDNGL